MTARAKLKKGRQPHWQELHTGIHIGYQRQKKAATGRWILRRYIAGSGNKYRITPLGIADDTQQCDGVKILSFNQAKAAANAMVEKPGSDKIQNITVRGAFNLYVESKTNEGQSVDDVMSRGTTTVT
jgi:hypothetical protein